MLKDNIEIRGASANNLKNIDVDIPRGKFTVITGLSGSGKSSLAFDTICAEGQRRYLNTLSPYAKHFIGVLEKPKVESISGLSPIISIEQKTTGNSPRSTVGTVTEIYDYLRLLFARASSAYSPTSGKEMVRYTDSGITDLIIKEYNSRKVLLLAPLVRGRKGHYRDLFERLRKRGFSQVRIDGVMEDLQTVDELDRYKGHFIELVIDRIIPSPDDESRIRSSVTSALSNGKGSVAIMPMDGQDAGRLRFFSKHFVDPDSGFSLQEPAPHDFSFNSPEGYCPHCKGLGTVVDADIDSIVPDRSLSIAEGGIIPLGKVRSSKKFETVHAMCRKYGFSMYDPIDTIPDEALSHIIFGSEDLFRVGEGSLSEMVTWDGLVGDIDRTVVCPVCHGTRLKSETECFRICGKTISEVSSYEITALKQWVDSLPSKLTGKAAAVAGELVHEISSRLEFILDVGLDYLTLDRPTASLSGGESQRIRLATQIGSKLVNVVYVLDEPSIGLHQRDNRKLLSSLAKLRDEGNTVVVVEHDLETMQNADYIVDIGPAAGQNGGTVTYCGKPTEEFLNGIRSIGVPSQRRKGNGRTLTIRGATGNNLKNIDASFPLGCLVGISGVSGSGKSTLVNGTLMPALKRILYRSSETPLPFRGIEGVENIDKVIEIDQSPIGHNPRSNPATYTGVWSDIRNLFEQTGDAKVRGFKARRFSFNVEGGRCEECKGAGIKVIEMNFLPAVNVVCDHCRGKRYKEDTLAVHYKGKSICDVLDMSIDEAYEFFKASPMIAPKLKALVDVGLGYIRLGQSAVTLSGGESQRMKLAAELSRKATGNTLYLLDEPTTGLHSEDIKVLLSVLNRLADQGNTIVVIEHNLDVLKNMDHIMDMGPEGGSRGGFITACGTPEELAANSNSVTGAFLKEVL